MFKFIKLIPWPLRVVLFIIISMPIFRMELITDNVGSDPISKLEAETAYACLVWVFVVSCVGLDRFISYFSVSAVLCVATVIVGGGVKFLLGFANQNTSGNLNSSEELVSVALMLFISLPYFFFVVESFSSSKMLEKISRRAGAANSFQLSVAVWLRVFQHLVEIFPGLIAVWTEEHPSKMWPRHSHDWKSSGILKRSAFFVDWLANSLWIWARCLLIFSLRIVPVVNHETIRIAREVGRRSK